MANSTLISQIKGIVTKHNTSGPKILWATEQAIDHMFNHKDWTPLAWLMMKIENKADASLVRRIVGQCVGGVTATAKGKQAFDQPSGMYITVGENAGYTAKMAKLRTLVEKGESFRSKTVKEVLLDTKTPEFDLHKYVKTMLKRLDDNHVTLADLLSEVSKVKKEESTIDIIKPEHMDSKIKAA